jgi:BRCT domain type II-containing protein
MRQGTGISFAEGTHRDAGYPQAAGYDKEDLADSSKLHPKLVSVDKRTDVDRTPNSDYKRRSPAPSRPTREAAAQQTLDPWQEQQQLNQAAAQQ